MKLDTKQIKKNNHLITMLNTVHWFHQIGQASGLFYMFLFNGVTQILWTNTLTAWKSRERIIIIECWHNKNDSLFLLNIYYLPDTII